MRQRDWGYVFLDRGSDAPPSLNGPRTLSGVRESVQGAADGANQSSTLKVVRASPAARQAARLRAIGAKDAEHKSPDEIIPMCLPAGQ